MEYKSLEATLESFGLNIAVVEEEIGLDEIESIPDFTEWLEKTGGNVIQAFRLYGLWIGLPSPEEPEKIRAWYDWRHEDPTAPTHFCCPGCDTDFWVVEAEGGNYWGSDILALSDYGELDDFHYILDSSDNLYNYEVPDYPDTDYTHVCGRCYRAFQGDRDGDRKSVIRYHSRDTVVDVNHESHVAYRENEYFDLPRSEREAIDSLIQHAHPEGWVRVWPVNAPDHRTAHVRNNIRSWLSSWGTSYKRDLDKYHFRFPSIVTVGIRQGYRIAGASLWVPDDPEAIEEAEEWIAGPASEYRRHRR